MAPEFQERNPYVGPRPFEPDERDLFFGRDREASEVLSLVIAHRVLLLYAESGAGKTSLVNAGVIPLLKEEGFEVLPLARVSGPIPQDTELEEISNLYVFNTLMSWTEGEADPKRLAQMSLANFLKEREHPTDEMGLPSARAVIFDQFEELFTFYPERWRDREGFFEQIGDALEGDPLLRVVFVMREDSIAQLDPYATFLPERLRTRFRLERLGKEAALSAVTGPLRDTERSFDEDAAEQLVEELLKVRVETAVGRTKVATGKFVEPVQLQVVCQSLWRDLPPGVTVITKDHLQAFGDVNQALAGFYERSIERTAQEHGIKVGDLRAWFEHSLITPAGTRGTVYRGREETGGAPNAAVDVLESLHLIRGEWRAGARWYELTHDRFIGPIQESNEIWREKRRQITLAARRAFAIVVAILVIAFAAVRAIQNRTEQQTRLATSARQLAAKAQAMLETHPQRSLLLAVEALNLTSQAGEPRASVAEGALRQALANSGGRGLGGHQKRISAIAISPDNHWLVTGSADATARLWDLTAPDPVTTPIVLRGHEDVVLSIAASPDNRWLVTGSADATARLWDLTAPDPAAASTVLRGHDGSIPAVAISPDNHWLVTGSADATARLWDLTDLAAKPIGLRGHEDSIFAVAISPDSRWLVTGSRDNTARLWDLTAPDPAATSIILRGHEDDVLAIAMSPDNHWLVTGSADATARLWDLTAPDPAVAPIVLRGHEDDVLAVAISLDSHWLVTGNRDSTARLWDLTAPDPAVAPIVLRGHDGPIFAVAISPDNHWLVTGSADDTARLQDLTNLAAKPIVLRGHDGAISAVAISPDNHWLVTGSADNAARLWDLTVPASAATPIVLRGHDGPVITVTTSPDNHWLVTGSADATARLWDLTDPTAEPIVLRGHYRSIIAVAVSSDSRWLVTGSRDNTARLWDLTAPDTAATPIVLRGHEDDILSITISSDSHWLVTGSRDNTARLWDLTAPDPAATSIILRGHEFGIVYEAEGITAVTISPDNHWLVTGSTDTTARLWDLTAPDPAAEPIVLRSHEDPISAIAISPDNHWLITGSADDTARLWDLTAPDPAAEPIVLRGHEDDVLSVAVSPDSYWLVTGSRDHTARLWDLTAPDPAAAPVILHGHEGSIFAVAIGPDKHWLVTGSADNTVRLWDLTNPAAEPIVLRGHEEDVLSVAISLDSHWLVTGSRDHTARLWTLRLDELIDLACRTAGRNLTRVEWEQYMGDELYRATCPNLPLSEESSPAPQVSVEAFVIAKEESLGIAVKPHTTITAKAEEIVEIKVEVAVTYEEENDFVFTWYTCNKGNNPVVQRIGNPEMLYVAPSEPGLDCIRVVIEKEDVQLDKDGIFVDVRE